MKSALAPARPGTLPRSTPLILTPTDILRIADDFAQRIWDAMFLRPGADADEVDAQAWDRITERIARWTAAGHVFQLVSVDSGSPMLTSAAWSVLIGIRNAEHRPTWAAVGELLEKHLGIEAPREMSGAEAQVRRIVTAPPAPEPPALPPGASDGNYVPSWMDRFRRLVSRDSGGPFDRVLLMPLMHLSDAEANRAIDVMIRERQAHERAKAEQRAQEVEKARVRAVRAAGGDALGRLCRALQQGAHKPVEHPRIDPTDDPVIRRGKHHIAEVGQPAGQGETR